MKRTFAITSAALFAFMSAHADDMKMSSPKHATSGASAYRFELAGSPQKGSRPGTSIVSVKLVHASDNRPVSGAIVIGEKADMSPVGMGMMTAPVQAMGEQNGTYQFAIQNGGVWKKPDNWALSIDAKVQGEPQTVHGNVIVKLTP